MLVLTRKAGESIKAGQTLIKVLSVKGNKVKLGFEAPDDVDIRRTELTDNQVPDQPELIAVS